MDMSRTCLGHVHLDVVLLLVDHSAARLEHDVLRNGHPYPLEFCVDGAPVEEHLSNS